MSKSNPIWTVWKSDLSAKSVVVKNFEILVWDWNCQKLFRLDVDNLNTFQNANYCKMQETRD